MSESEPKMQFTDLELEEMFYEKLYEAGKNIIQTNKRAILRDMRNKLKTLSDGSMKVNFTASMQLYNNNDMTLDMGCQYDIKDSHKDKLDRIEIKYEQPDLLDGIDEETNLLDEDGVQE